MMTPYTTIFLILLVSIATARGRCPEQSLFEPCTCDTTGEYTDVRCSNISTVEELQKVMDNTLDYPFDIFLLRESTIPYLKSTWFVKKGIKILALQSSTLIGMFDRVPDVTLPLVSEIVVHNTSLFRSVQWPGFKPFVKLGTLSVLETEVKRLGKEFRDNVTPELQVLNMEKTKTSKLEDGVFAGKKKLNMIGIRSGKLRILKSSYFEDQKNVLRTMDFSYNPIESLPDDLFQGMKALQFVELKGAKIKTLSKELYFGGFLNVEENPLICDCKMSWVSNIYDLQVDGTCVSPPNLQSKRLRDLTKEDFAACRNALPFEH